jgi:hypothetical protein
MHKQVLLAVFWVVMPCGVVSGHQCFRGTYIFRGEVRSVKKLVVYNMVRRMFRSWGVTS